MMPVVDGPATLRRLRGNPETAGIPIVFMTALRQKHEFGRFRSFGAVDVIAKPFDPNTLAALVRRHLPPMEPDAIEGQFLHRLRSDAETMAKYRETLKSDPMSSVALEGAQACAHKLAGAAGVFGFQTVSCAAESLEGSIIDRRAGRGAPRTVEILLDSLLDCLERK
jgi:response regulator RpfG family c-di-GMP phosphodiesterase